jgi:COPII coat assembly protein SEC16
MLPRSFRSFSCRPQIDVAIRSALVPRLEMSSGAPALDATTSTPVMALSLPADTVSSLSSFSYPGLAIAPSTSQETPIAVSTLYPSTVDKIQEFLLRGERQKAYHFALDEKLWAHAMVIASSIDKEAWKEVVNEFLKTELGRLGPNAETASKPDGRESLRVAYSMFSGQGAAAGMFLLVPSR